MGCRLWGRTESDTTEATQQPQQEDWAVPGGSDGKGSACNAGDPGSLPGWGRSPGEGNGNPLQYSCLENPMDRAAWWAIVTLWGGKESDTTERLHFHFQENQIPHATTKTQHSQINKKY